MLARYPGPFLQKFLSYNKLADSGDMMTQKQGFSNVDTHVPAIAKALLFFSHIGL